MSSLGPGRINQVSSQRIGPSCRVAAACSWYQQAVEGTSKGEMRRAQNSAAISAEPLQDQGFKRVPTCAAPLDGSIRTCSPAAQIVSECCRSPAEPSPRAIQIGRGAPASSRLLSSSEISSWSNFASSRAAHLGIVWLQHTSCGAKPATGLGAEPLNRGGSPLQARQCAKMRLVVAMHALIGCCATAGLRLRRPTPPS